ncbi:MAG: nitroreductase [Oscillospiraceae bacterium]|nr:nitroreductase [Oscillospiraceae bacterium]
MNAVLEAMQERRSVRKFLPDMPQKELIEQITEAGCYAASGMNRQAVITIAVTNPELRSRLSEANRKIGGWQEGVDPFYGAPVILVVLAEEGCSTGIYDGSLVMGNLMLAAHSLGLGSIWIHRAKEEFESPEWKALLSELHIEGSWTGIGHCAVGYIDGEAPDAPPRRENRIYWAE